jgi:ribonuclease HIII
MPEVLTLLENGSWEISKIPYSVFKATGNHTTVVAYESGKLVVQGRGTEEFVLYTLEPEILHTFDFQSSESTAAAPQVITPHGGIDESGKGDFFGPLVIAGVCVDPQTGSELAKLGVCDSKLIHSDKKIIQLADSIRSICAGHYSSVTLMPETYNRLYSQIGNLNRLLAWGHARIIENLLEATPDCPRMLSDKFGSEHLIKNALMERGRKIVLEQETKAERDIAVAAASILARDGFLRGMRKLNELCHCELPRGAGPQVKTIGRELLSKHSRDILNSCAKLHFKTAAEL